MTDVNATDAAGRLGALLLQVWEQTSESGETGFQDRALRLLAGALPFDAAIWGYAHSAAGSLVPHTVFLYRIPPDAVEGWKALRADDRLTVELLARPGIAVLLDGDRDSAALAPALQDFNRRHKLHHGCAVAFGHAFSGLGVFVSLYRRRGAPAFSPDDARLLELACPHLSAAFDTYRRRSLMANAGYTGIGGGAALVDRHGFLHLTDEPFLRLLRLGWPQWQGPQLPPECLATAGADVHRKGVVVSWRPLQGESLNLYLARPDGAADLLTFRQAEIARAYASGKQHKAIALELKITPATVRNHLRLIYGVLGVRNKVELVAALESAPQISLHRGARLSG